ncbi:MAG: T9SS type A sorting domain-containing protein [Crocinitomicaceae bacterium]|nr:T9SS type A sorting domain-containing protein [Crocinitomicaceae bacterium]
MKLPLLLAICLIASSTFAQTIHKCASYEAIQYQESITPGFINQVNSVFNASKAYSVNNSEKSNPIYNIPVVVHIVYNSPEQNLADSVIYNQLEILNKDYNRLNADTVNMRSDFDIVKGNPQINFTLAQIDENGAPTTGITRTSTATTSFGSFAFFTGDFSDLEKVKSTVDGGHDPWDQSRYLNIWVCNMSINILGQETTALLGYATPPAGLPNWPVGSVPNLNDGVVIQFQAFGSNNPNILDAGNGPINVKGRTAIHEVGHYLGLRHIWGDGDCNEQDGIDDTPNADAQSNQDCDFIKNTCIDNIQGVDLPDMVENYMDYSEETCQNSFTQGQVDLMHGVLENERYNLVYNNPAGLTEINAFEFNLYPNPASNKFTVKSMEKIERIQLISITGQTLRTIDVNSTSAIINTDDLTTGLYYIIIASENQQTMSESLVIH